ncbi:MAG TPA: hypothetical protein VFQ65_02290 [Kofleriaceae bacterium]|nr:hypothetical protein [Kofleriaceae bacterium]
MWRWSVCSLVLGACTDSGLAPMDTQFQVSASVHDARIWFSVFGTDLSVMPYEDNQIITDAQASATFRGQTIPLRFGPGSPVPGNFGAVDLESDVTAD